MSASDDQALHDVAEILRRLMPAEEVAALVEDLRLLREESVPAAQIASVWLGDARSN